MKGKAHRHEGTEARRAVVIGGGPAGASAAFHLARAGWEVIVIEARLFPRAKVCGEFVSPAATELLESIVPPRSLREAGARLVRDLVIECGGRSVRWPMAHARDPGAWVLSRRSLDAMLLEAARGAGATVLQPARVREVRYFDECVEIDVENRESIEGAVIIHADGVGRFDGGSNTPMRPGVVGLKCHLRLPTQLRTGTLKMRACRGAYVGTVDVENGSTTLALVARKSVINPFQGDSDALLQSLWPTFDPAWREGPWLACGVASGGSIASGHPRSFRAGNASGAVEPVGGEGIGLALWSGRELSRALSEPEGLLPVAQHAYRRAYRARLRVRRPACRLAAEVLMKPALVRSLWPALTAPAARDLLLGSWYRLTGKPGGAWMN